MLSRKEYLEQLKTWKDKQIIKVITGVRRCGKSTLFQLYTNYLKSVGIRNEQILSVNLEDLTYENLLDYKALYRYFKERLFPDGITYIFIDEVQNCPNFEKAVDSLMVQPNVDIYITGSNAFMLSGELATLLSGRYVTIDMLPLSFSEYWEATEKEGNSKQEAFNDYLRYGSFPYVTALGKNDATIWTYIDGIYNTILVKDVAQREGITDIPLLESIVKTLAGSIGSPVSTKKISDTINSSGRRISVNTVDRYLKALTNSYIFYKAERYDLRGRQYLKTLGKYYLVDTGLRNLLLSSASADTGHLIENIVFLELLRRGNKVNIGKLGDNEVDFVIRNSTGTAYYQVASSVLDEHTLRRELEPLQHIPDNYPKYLLTLDEVGAGTDYEGIKQLNLINWLLEK